jgi:hypothetical protein
MLLMLTFIFLCVAVGLLARRFGARQHMLVVFLAATMTALYFFVSKLL